MPTKNEITQYVQKHGGNTRYSGKLRTMFVSCERNNKIEWLKDWVEIFNEVPNLPLKLVFQ